MLRLSFLVCIVLLARAVAQDAPAFTLVVKNGGMTQGFDLPADWQKEGPGTLVRDTAIFHTGPAALRLEAAAQATRGFQQLAGGAGAKFKLAGWLKTAGSVQAQVFVHAFAEGFKQNQYQQVKYAAGAGDWAPFEKEITLPAWTSFFRVGLMVEGQGQAWLDEVREAGGAVDAGQPQTEAQRRVSGPPPKAKPSVPGWGFYPQFPTAWQSHFDQQLQRTKQGGVEMVFLGDSITQGWSDAGKAVWQARYEPRQAVNYGIGGDSTRQVLWRLEHGLVDGLAPKVVVLNIGTNNLYDDHNGGSDEEIAEGIAAVVRVLRAKLPGAQLLVCGLLPRQNVYFTQRILAINARIKPLDDGQQVRVLDLTERFQSALGQVRPELYHADQLHLARPGYEAWAAALEPWLAPLGR